MLQTNCIGGVMVSVLDSSVIDHGLQKNLCDRSWVTDRLVWCNVSVV